MRGPARQWWHMRVKGWSHKFLVKTQQIVYEEVRQFKSNGQAYQHTTNISQILLTEIKPRNKDVIIEIEKTEQHNVGHNVLQKRPAYGKERHTRWAWKYQNGHYHKKEEKENMGYYCATPRLAEHPFCFGKCRVYLAGGDGFVVKGRVLGAKKKARRCAWLNYKKYLYVHLIKTAGLVEFRIKTNLP